MRERARRWFAVVCVFAAVLVPGVASAQVFPLPRIEAGPRGITIIPMPGVTPAIRIPGTFGTAPRPLEPAPAPAPAPAAPPPFAVPEAPAAPPIAAPAAPPPFAVPEAPAAPPVAAPAPSGSGRTVGVFVGISDYPSANDLEYCASDAFRVQRAFVQAGIMSPADTVVLTDSQATRAAVANAIERLSRQLSPGDTLVFFFSGHGNQIADDDRDELDGTDETILLHDGAMTDDELSALLGQGRHREMVALDSCYSGGFARDVARLNDSVGFYASREDQLSYVATEHQAGGYLSYHLAESIAQSQGRPLATWELQRDLRDGFARSNRAGQQDLTVGVSRDVNLHTVVFERDTRGPQLASL